jgi:squalene synthase HpnC
VETIHIEDNREATEASNGIDAGSSIPTVSLGEAERFCRQLATSHYENFVVASLFLPVRMRQPFYNVYAYCRYSDDLADLSPSPQEATRKLLDWRKQLSDCFAGRATHPIFVALADTAGKHRLEIGPFADLLQAFLQDQSKTRYQTMDELLDYCKHSANPVGRIVLRLANADSDANVRLSDSICTGLQLANHWQDVARDVHAGRIYLPREDAEKFGVDLEQLEQQANSADFRRLIEYECDRAETFLRAGMTLAGHVPQWLAKDIRLFVLGGLATLQAIDSIQYDVLTTRPTVSKWKQLKLIAGVALSRQP